MVKCLDNNEAAAQEARQRSLDEMKRSLDEQAKLPKNNALGMDGPLNLEVCGPSSLQCFSGEDHSHENRKKNQQEQVKYWCAEYVLEKKRATKEERRREQEYAEYVLEQDRIRTELEQESTRRKEEEARLRQLENMEYARHAQLRKEQERDAYRKGDASQTHYLQTCALLTEDTTLARNVNAEHRFRPDHFKGFQKERIKALYQENDAVVEEKRDICNQEANTEAEWARHHADMVQKMEEAEKSKQMMIAEENHIHREILAQQKEELNKRKAEMEQEKVNSAIGTEFFKRFGQSCR